MYETYRFVRNQYFPGAVLLCDSFHVIKNINKVLDDIRIKVGKRYQKDSTEYYLLKKFHFLILKNYNDIPFNKARYNKKLKRYIDYHQLLEIILSIDKELTEAYNLKEQYIAFNHYATSEAMQRMAFKNNSRICNIRNYWLHIIIWNSYKLV
ncbi:MAG: transposase [Catenibacterium sp.]|uniref:transposase n=1 Tax=Catenibacterium sp. TaxID=2049022 RepID=UPI00399165DD